MSCVQAPEGAPSLCPSPCLCIVHPHSPRSLSTCAIGPRPVPCPVICRACAVGDTYIIWSRPPTYIHMDPRFVLLSLHLTNTISLSLSLLVLYVGFLFSWSHNHQKKKKKRKKKKHFRSLSRPSIISLSLDCRLSVSLLTFTSSHLALPASYAFVPPLSSPVAHPAGFYRPPTFQSTPNPPGLPMRFAYALIHDVCASHASTV